MKTVAAFALVVLLGTLTQPAWADDLMPGTWTGFAVRQNANQNRQPVQLIVKKVPDPYVAWRGGSGELLSVVFQIANQNNQREVSDASLADGRLTFSFLPPDADDTATCVFTLQPKENTYVGDCVNRRITLTPPAPARPTDAKPAEAK